MTTDRRSYFTADVFAVNAEVRLPSPVTGRAASMAAMSFARTTVAGLRVARQECLRDAVLAIAKSGTDTTQMRLLVADPALQPDGVRVRNMSRVRESSIKELLANEDWIEVLSVGAGGARWFSDLPIDRLPIEGVESVMFKYRFAAVVVGVRTPIVHHYLHHGWPGMEKWPRSGDAFTHFISETASVGAVAGLTVLRLWGAFDDREVSADIFGPIEEIQKISSSR